MANPTVEVLTEPPRLNEGERRGQPGSLAFLDQVSFVMDRLIEVPGTRLRVGLNTLLMLLPVAGDGIASLVSLLILVVGLSNHRVPRIVAARMVTNSLLDACLGWVPLVGDLFDLFYKADTRNVRLLIEYAGRDDRAAPSTWRHWVFVLSVLGALVLAAAGLVWGTVLLFRQLPGLGG